MQPDEQRQHPTAQSGNSRVTAIRVAKWLVIALVLLFLLTRVIRYFLQ
jgi:flagellar biosynthesis/type III secretory pathway M-ring protein FliF/YscJ